MIVKDESSVIERCLTSVLPLIDKWVIVDTGSTDGTQQIIKDFMAAKGVPGELHERPWVNFGHNRNEALQHAKGKSDYILFIDADEYFVYEPDFKLPQLDKDFYFVTISHSGSKYGRVLLIKNRPEWIWMGVVHEAIVPFPGMTSGTLEKVFDMYTTEGARSKDPQKYLKDAQILEAALKIYPHDTRNVFYLAQSYRDAGLYALGLQYYEKRAAMGGWEEEVFWSMLQVALIKEFLEMPKNVVIESLLKTYAYRNSRIEPLHHVARIFRENGDYQSGYLSAKSALALPRSDDILFVEQWMYDYGTLLELSVCAYWIGKYDECREISENLLKRDDLPLEIRSLIERNLKFAIEKSEKSDSLTANY